MAKLHHKEYKENYKNYILECIEDEDDITGKNFSDDEKINYLFNRFYSEYGFYIERQGKHSAMTEWLSGLSISIPYMYDEIIQLAIDMGSIDENPSEALESIVIKDYFSFMANMILSFEPKEVA
jgi:hypothetical protein